jgi:hypothetical protein
MGKVRLYYLAGRSIINPFLSVLLQSNVQQTNVKVVKN